MTKNVKSKTFQSNWQAAALLFPTIAVVIAFLYYPAIETFRYSFFGTIFFGTDMNWVGLDNYIYLLQSSEYHRSLMVTTLWAVFVMAGEMILALLIAYLIHEVSRGSSIYMILAIWPYAMPAVVAAAILGFLFNPGVGIINHVLDMYLGVEFNFRNNPLHAFLILAGTAIWKGIGFNVIFLLAALANVPDSLIEVPRLDGVGRLRTLRHVYVPLISPTLFYLLVLSLIRSFFGGFALVDLITGGGPDNWTNFLIYKLYTDAFDNLNVGLGSAESVILILIVAGLTIIQFRYTEKFVHYG